MPEKTEFEKSMEMFNKMLKQLPKDQLIADKELNDLENRIASAKTIEEKEKILNDFKSNRDSLSK